MITRRVVFVADDLGFDAPTDCAVAESVAAGLVREVSAVVTCGGPGAGVERVRAAQSDVGIGLHLSLTAGRSLTGRIRGVTDRDGWFRPMPAVLARGLMGGIDDRAVEAEIRAQLIGLESLGVAPTHLDGHEHVHAFPGVRDAVLRVLADRPMHVRVPREADDGGLSLRCRVVSTLARGLERLLASSGAQAASSPFVGLSLYRHPRYAEAMIGAAAALGSSPVEWMVHPRYGDARAAAERRALCDPGVRRRLDALGIVAVRFDERAG